MSDKNSHLPETVPKTVQTPIGAKKVKVPSDLQSREDSMKDYFQGMEKPGESNANIKKKSQTEVSVFSQIRKMINFDYMWKGLFTYQSDLIAETEILKYLHNLQWRLQIGYGSLFCAGFGAFSTVKFYYFSNLTRILGFLVSAFSGVIFAKLKVNHYATGLIPRSVFF